MSKLLHGEVTEQVLGAAFEVHRELGPGFLESVYEKAMAYALEDRGVPFRCQVHVPIFFRDRQVGEHYLDLLVDEKVVVELKAVKDVSDIHRSIVLAYLAATRLSVALILNFRSPSLVHKRVVR